MVQQGLWNVRPVTRQDCQKFIIGIHYAQRWPSVSFAFGLFVGSELKGVVTYGTPSSSTLRAGVCGPLFEERVIELNRLVLLDNKKNQASYLVAASLRELKKLGDFIVVSYADASQGHSGFVYQAANFIYTGLSAKRTDWHIDGKEHLHSQTLTDEFRNEEDRVAAAKAKYGDAFKLVERPRKHRYVYFVGGRRFKKVAEAALRYPVSPYPKKASSPKSKTARIIPEGQQPRLL